MKAMAPHSSTLAWKIPWMEEPGGLQSMGLLRVRHDWATSLSLFHFHALEKEMATHSSVLAWRIPGGRRAWWADVYGVTQSWTLLKWLSSNSNRAINTGGHISQSMCLYFTLIEKGNHKTCYKQHAGVFFYAHLPLILDSVFHLVMNISLIL